MAKKEYQRHRHKTIYKPAYDAWIKFYPFGLDDLDGEQWLPIPNHDSYQVSNFGRIKSFKHNSPRILKPVLARGYLYITLSKCGVEKTFRVHRLIALCFIPNPENKPHINHRDGCKLNNVANNLEWCTSSENNQHAYDIGLKKSCGDNPRAKLTNEQIILIRDNPEGMSRIQLAEMFGVAASKISDIQIGKIYKRIGGVVRKSAKPPVPKDLRKKLKQDYIPYHPQFGARALARQYNIDHKTVLRIVNQS